MPGNIDEFELYCQGKPGSPKVFVPLGGEGSSPAQTIKVTWAAFFEKHATLSTT